MSYEHELTTEVPNDFPGKLLGAIRAATTAERVLIDQEGDVLRVAVADEAAAEWLVEWLDDRPEDGAQGLADLVADAFGTADLPEE